MGFTQEYDAASSAKWLPAPWDDEVSRRAPIDIVSALHWCEYAALTNQTVYAAIRRLVSYFITEIEIENVDRKEKERLLDYLYDTLHIDSHLYAIGMDYMIYGNSFSTIYTPIQRSVSCPKCNFSVGFEKYALNPASNFSYSKGNFNLKCKQCGFEGPWKVSDSDSKQEDSVSIVRWNPHDMIIHHDMLTQQSRFLWRVSSEYKAYINKSSPLHLASAPMDLLEAIDDGNEFLFDKGTVLHLKEYAPAGIRMQGWGLSPILANFRQTWYLEILRRANQAIGYDYILPLRIISPEPRAGGGEFGDALQTTNFDSVNAKMSKIITSWRKDPTSWHSAPFPIRYQPLGGEGNRIIPAQIMDQGNAELISSMGMPVEFFRGTMAMNVAPVALRILEGTWKSLMKLFNIFLSHLANKLSVKFKWDSFNAKIARPSHMDDINRQMAKLQLAMSGMTSMTTGLKSIGLDFNKEFRQQMEEEQFKAEESMEAQKDMENIGMGDMLAQPQQDMGGGMGGMLGGMMGGASGDMAAQGEAQAAGAAPGQVQGAQNPVEQILAMVPDSTMAPVSPSDIMAAADQIAQTLMQIHPSFRISALRRIASKNELVHAVVSKKVEELRNMARLEGQVQNQQQAQQAGQQQFTLPM